jgi:uncharacterized protein YcbX
MQVSNLFIYPVKSCAGVSVQRARIGRYGFEFDRSMVIVKASTKRFQTQRQLPAMALLEPSVDFQSGQCTLSAPKLQLNSHVSPSVSFSLLSDVEAPRVEIGVWSWRGLAEDAGDECADWLSEALGQRVRLMRMCHDHARPAGIDVGGSLNLNSFADDFPFLLASQVSLRELNRLVAGEREPGKHRELDMRQFRPNIVVDGRLEPFEEDHWSELRIDERWPLHVLSRCKRCRVTTVDPDQGRIVGGELGRDGRKKPVREPLYTLLKYRRDPTLPNQCYFGVNVSHSRKAIDQTIQIGASIRIQN